MLVGVVGELVPFPHQDPDGHAGGLHIQHRKAAPGFFGKHHLALYFVHIGFDVRTLLFIANQNTVTAGSHHYILEAHAEKRNVQFIDDSGVLTAVAQDDIADSRFRHLFGHGVPGSDILPHTIILHAVDGCLFFHHCVVKADFFQGFIAAVKRPVVGSAEALPHNVQQIPQFEGKHAAVPQSALGNIFFRQRFGRFFLERSHPHDLAGRNGHDVAIFFGRVGGFYPQQVEIPLPFFCGVGQRRNGSKILRIHIRVNRAHRHRFAFVHLLFAREVRRCQRNGRKGVPPGGLHANGNFVAQLVHQCAYLFFAGGHGNVGLGHSSTDLPIHPLYHGFVLALLIFENF